MVIIRQAFYNTPKQNNFLTPLEKMTDKEKTETIYQALLEDYESDDKNLRDWITIREARCGTGYNFQNQRSFDFLAISSRAGNAVVVYEVKASRSDFLKDVKNPEKQKALRCFANLFYYIAPQGVIRTEELPPWAGLKELVYDSKGNRFVIVERAVPPQQANFPPTWGFVAACIRNRSEWQTRKLLKANEELSLENIRLQQECESLRLKNFLLKKKEAENAK